MQESIVYVPFNEIECQNDSVLQQIIQKFNLVQQTADEIDQRLRQNQSQLNLSTKWSPQEHALFLHCLESTPRTNYAAISAFVRSKNPKQVSTHSARFFEKLERHYNMNLPDAEIREFVPLLLPFIKKTPIAMFWKAVVLIKEYMRDNAQVQCVEISNSELLIKRCVFTNYFQYVNIDYKTVAQKFAQVLRASENVVVAAGFVADKMILLPQHCILCLIIEYFNQSVRVEMKGEQNYVEQFFDGQNVLK
ncbi:Myb-like_DNA-binding domain-containing protein [Hexamita inflata]|uniref:Myb-like_DNA-binding domain-containing protein n=1 Tax=Hexamita inflata TaxID=28002 RepID=A0ABP1GUV2_9EUKA